MPGFLARGNQRAGADVSFPTGCDAEDVRSCSLSRYGVDEISAIPKAEHLHCKTGILRTEDPADLFHFPEVVTPLLPLAVGILRGIKAAVGRPEIAKDVFHNLPCSPAVLFADARPESLRCRQGKKRLIIKHLFKVRNQPFPIRAVAVKAVSELIEDPAPAHGPEGSLRHPDRLPLPASLPVPEQEQQLMGHRKFRGIPESAELLIVLIPKFPEGFGEEFLTRGFSTSRYGLPENRQRPGRLRFDPFPLRPPEFDNPRDQLDEPFSAPPALLRNVGGRKEGAPLRRHDDGQRPSPAPGHYLADPHVNPVDIRPLLAIHLDANESPVQKRGCLFILEGFVGHDMAPMAGGISDRQEDRLVLRFCP